MAAAAAARRRRLPLAPAPPKAPRRPAPGRPRPPGPPPGPPPLAHPPGAQLLLQLAPASPPPPRAVEPESGACRWGSRAWRDAWNPESWGGGREDNAVKNVHAVPLLPAGPPGSALRPGTLYHTPRPRSSVRAGVARGRARVGEGRPERIWHTTPEKEPGGRDWQGVWLGQG